MAWEPDDALVEKAMAAAMNAAEGSPGKAADMDAIYRAEVRAALIAARDDMVAAAVKAEREACAEMMRGIPLIGERLASDIRARQP